ncbi:AAA family ATPase [Carboxydothermus ferrireducens]|uniref:MoxR-like ATPase n=1 Tax=Carboxydothermus ferrireducens DSM 11255 TaxID=1119529 RepID=A0ABX2R7A0_9THEO|nr:MoxR family ATPase [Carboxydothermus ferrireducens]NYE57036.1 MoxR-like ATPase [Carboxydothermus ferrireducens DSM 11255]
MENYQNLLQKMEEAGYLTSPEIAIPVFLALKLNKPILVEGPPGVGKTELAKVLAKVLNTDLIRLQCYEGLDEAKALYEWNYHKQLIAIQSSKNNDDKTFVFSEEYLLERPLLKALRAQKKPVLLIDEIDKVDEEFEAFLFELLSDFQVTIPELGTIKAREIPLVVLTSNGSRELSDGLKRRAVYLYIDFPDIKLETKIILKKVKEIHQELAEKVATAVHFLRRELDLYKPPAISETLDWAKTLALLGDERLTKEFIENTIGFVLKNKEDIETFYEKGGANRLLQYIDENT